MRPSAEIRSPLLGLHVAYALPLVALAVWFGILDRPAAGAKPCASCGVEAYVVAAHLAAAAWLGLVVARASAIRRELSGERRAPGGRTVAGLAAAAVLAVAVLVWPDAFTPVAATGMLASLILAPAGAIWWTLAIVGWRRRPAATGAELRRRASSTLTASWLCLALLLPGTFGWVWTDRVAWLVF